MQNITIEEKAGKLVEKIIKTNGKKTFLRNKYPEYV